jgi:hypothetical protein
MAHMEARDLEGRARSLTVAIPSSSRARKNLNVDDYVSFFACRLTPAFERVSRI